jgi:hypothetical protein
LKGAQATQLRSYCHFRNPVTANKKSLLQKEGLSASLDFLDTLDEDIPKGRPYSSIFAFRFLRSDFCVSIFALTKGKKKKKKKKKKKTKKNQKKTKKKKNKHTTNCCAWSTVAYCTAFFFFFFFFFFLFFLFFSPLLCFNFFAFSIKKRTNIFVGSCKRTSTPHKFLGVIFWGCKIK